MSEIKNKFRVVSIGGFHKDDVLTYISSIEHKVAVLRDEFAIEKKNMQQDIEEAQTIKEQFEMMYIENQSFKAENEELKTRLAEATRGDENATIIILQQEIAQLKFKLQQSTGQKEELSRLKDALVQIELDARARATELESKSKEQAEAILVEAYQKSKEIESASEVRAKQIKSKIDLVTSTTFTEFAKIDEILLSIAEKNQSLKQEMETFSNIFKEEKELPKNDIYEQL